MFIIFLFINRMRTKASKALDKLLNKVGSIDSKSITSGDIEELKSA